VQVVVVDCVHPPCISLPATDIAVEPNRA
jgi:hypothetical protein